MITYWMWKSVNFKHLEEIVIVMLITPIMLAGDIFGFPFEIVGYLVYLITKEK